MEQANFLKVIQFSNLGGIKSVSGKIQTLIGGLIEVFKLRYPHLFFHVRLKANFIESKEKDKR
jgi:hypothetical protein